jgi:hypothetical protein
MLATLAMTATFYILHFIIYSHTIQSYVTYALEEA